MRTDNHAYWDGAANAVVVEHLTVCDKDVTREASRWTTGERGPVVEHEMLVGADLSEFVTEAIKIGAHALSATGQSQDAHALERMLKEVGEKASHSTNKAAEHTERAVRDATETVVKAAADAKRAIVEADEASRKEFTKSVAAAKADLNEAIRSTFGGEHPELLDRLQPLLDGFSTTLDARSKSSIAEVMEKAVKQFDPSDPTSPMAKHTAGFEARQQQLVQQIDKNHDVVLQKIDDLSTALKVQEARTTLSKVTPIKGDTYENEVNNVLSSIAAGLGDEYIDTRAIVGAVPRSKKGDGLLTIDGGSARVVVEMTDSARVGWAEYLEEAERNRHAGAALGLVRTVEQNGGFSIRTLGARRIVLAYDPTSDDPDLVRTVVMLLRAAALSSNSRRGGEQIVTAEEKISEAVAQLDKIDDIKKAAGSIHKNADKVESACTAIHSGIERLLADALAALTHARGGVAADTAANAVA
ncbi:Fis family transcriptional regulator [Mycobacterium sp. OAE908]